MNPRCCFCNDRILDTSLLELSVQGLDYLEHAFWAHISCFDSMSLGFSNASEEKQRVRDCRFCGDKMAWGTLKSNEIIRIKNVSKETQFGHWGCFKAKAHAQTPLPRL